MLETRRFRNLLQLLLLVLTGETELQGLAEFRAQLRMVFRLAQAALLGKLTSADGPRSLSCMC